MASRLLPKFGDVALKAPPPKSIMARTKLWKHNSVSNEVPPVGFHCSTRAYTLPEVMISVAIFAIMMGSLFAGFSYGFASIKATREDLRATQILTGKVEAIRLCTWGQLSNCPSSFVDYYDPQAAAGGRGTVYSGTIGITLPTNISNSISYRDKMRLVNVSISWTNSSRGNAPLHRRNVQTLSALNGMQNYIWGIP
jgi:prepilin-type N-terminal cleavage/methylation domain-containing protein